MKKLSVKLFPLFLLLCLSCKKNKPENTNPIPYVSVSTQINIDNPQYIDLNKPGGFVYLNDEGYKGIVVVKDFSDQFYALDRTCSYHPEADCAQVTMDKSGLSLRCGKYVDQDFDACCESKYSLDGNVLSGPATYPLKQYTVTKNGSILYISN